MEYIQFYHMMLSIVHLKIASYQRELISQEKGENPLKTKRFTVYAIYFAYRYFRGFGLFRKLCEG